MRSALLLRCSFQGLAPWHGTGPAAQKMIAAIHAGVRAGQAKSARNREEEREDENLQLLPQVADFDAPIWHAIVSISMQ